MQTRAQFSTSAVTMPRPYAMHFKSDGSVEKWGDGQPSLMMQVLAGRVSRMVNETTSVIEVASGTAGEPVSASSQAALEAALAMSDSSDESAVEAADEEVTKNLDHGEHLHGDTTNPEDGSPKNPKSQDGKKAKKKTKGGKKKGKGMKFGK